MLFPAALEDERKTFYQFFTLHALHQSLKEMDGVTLAEVEGLLDGGDDVSLHAVRKTTAGETQPICARELKWNHELQ